MPAIPRKVILDRFRAMIAEGRAIVGGGAGTGLSAKAEEAGGIDPGLPDTFCFVKDL
jgi:predicted TIM-barrel enzyme